MLCNVVHALLVGVPGATELLELPAQVAKMTQREAAQPGDVLRAFTCTNFVFPTNSLFGAKPPVQLPHVRYGTCHPSSVQTPCLLFKQSC